jgi:hypothetical protein
LNPLKQGWLSNLRGRISEKPGARTKLAALLLGILLLSSTAAFGAARDFIPTIYTSGGDFDLAVLQQRNENTTAGGGARSSDLYASERLRLFLGGFSFHPRFIQFLFTGSGGLSQERSEGTTFGSFSENGVGTEYDFRTKILPEHPYNLELYTLRATPLLRGQSSAESRTTVTEKGAIFNYAKRPVFFNIGYNTGKNETRISSSEQTTARVRGSYHTGPFNNSAAYSRTDSSTSSGTQAVVDFSSFENSVAWSDISLVSKVQQKRSTQSSFFSNALDTDTLSWTEQFNAPLPWNFSTSASYNFQRDSIAKETTAAERKEDARDAQSAGFTLAHKLYDSVRTAYAMNQSWTKTSSGDTTSVSNAVNGSYTKKVPDGRVTISARGSQSVVDRENAPLIVGEVYTAPLFGTFTLTSEGVDPATIIIRVLSDAGPLIDLARDRDYIVERFGNAAVITIVALPPDIAAGQPAGQIYTFHVTYTLRAGAAELETTTAGYTINLSLLNNLLNPYYSRQRSGQTVLSGSVPGGGEATDSAIMGIMVQKAPYSITSEYQTTESAVSPSHSLHNSADYSMQMSDTLNVAARMQHSKTVHGEGTLGTGGFTEQVSAFNAAINKNVPKKNLTSSLGTSYSRRHATIDTDIYGITGNLSWNFGTLSVRLSAALNRSQTTAVIGKQTVQSEFYYLTVSRKLF